MNDLTYIIPTRIESEDRLKNIITSVTYLLKNIPEAKVIVKEVSDINNECNSNLEILQKSKILLKTPELDNIEIKEEI